MPNAILEIGFWGSNVETYGGYYRGLHFVVDDGDMGLPGEGGEYRIGIYKHHEDQEQLFKYELGAESGFSIERASKEITEAIDDYLDKGISL